MAEIGEAFWAVIVIAFVGLLTACVEASVGVCISLVWTDFLHDNPYRTASDAVTMALASPVYGTLLGVFVFGPSILVGAALAGGTVLIHGRLPGTAMAGISAAAMAAWVAQSSAFEAYIGPEGDFPDSADVDWPKLAGVLVLLTIALHVGWWMHRRLTP